MKIKKKMGEGSRGGRGGGRVGSGGVRVDVNEELKFLWKFKKIFFFFGGGVGRGVRGGVRGRFGVGRGQGGCERRIEVFVKIKKKNEGGRGRVLGLLGWM